jgi:hypothetical protein
LPANFYKKYKSNLKMKKVLSILAAASMLAVIACGPSAEEKKKAEEKRIQDSIEASQRMADSLAAMEAAMMPADTTVAVDSTTMAK